MMKSRQIAKVDESGDFRAKDLREVLCVEDFDVDLFSGITEQEAETSPKQG